MSRVTFSPAAIADTAPEWFVGQYHFEGKSILMGYEQIQLQGPFVLVLRLLAHKDKSVATAPGLRFPVRFKVVTGGID